MGGVGDEMICLLSCCFEILDSFVSVIWFDLVLLVAVGREWVEGESFLFSLFRLKQNGVELIRFLGNDFRLGCWDYGLVLCGD